MDVDVDRSSWRLLPSEAVLWAGSRTPGVPHDRRWIVGPVLLLAFATVSALFAALLLVAHLPGARHTAFVAAYATLFAAAVWLAPRYLFDACEYVVTDRRILWRRGRIQRQMDRHAVTFARVRWHRSVPGVGHLELVRAVPFGPLARKQRIVLHDVRAPDVVFAIVRGVEPGQLAGDPDVPLAERLDRGEELLWGDHPEGVLLDWRHAATATLGAAVFVLGVLYGHRTGAVLLGLEEVGLSVRSWEWVLFFFAIGITWATLVGVGVALLWHGIWRARGLGRDTEYVLTDRRLLIRRGRIELSVDRRRIVDVADAPARRGLHHLFLVLDAPHSRALADSGALGPVLPSRDNVPPVLYDLRDVERVKDLILARGSKPDLPPMRDAA